MKKKMNIRLWIQAAWTALTNGYALGFTQKTIYRGDLKKFCVPGLNCYSCPGALGSCPIGSLQATLNSGNFKIPFYILGFLMLFGSIFGRFVCGWLCPFGLLQDLLHKIPVFKKVKNLRGHDVLVWVKYGILGLFVFLLPLFAKENGVGKPWFCEYICPSGTLMGGIPLVVLEEKLRAAIGFRFWWKIALLLIIILVSMKVYRPFCKYLCPLGAVYGLFNPIAFLRFNIDAEKCTGCKACQKACKMNIPVYLQPNSRECIRCGDCRRACPTGAIVRVNILGGIKKELEEQGSNESAD